MASATQRARRRVRFRLWAPAARMACQAHHPRVTHSVASVQCTAAGSLLSAVVAVEPSVCSNRYTSTCEKAIAENRARDQGTVSPRDQEDVRRPPGALCVLSNERERLRARKNNPTCDLPAPNCKTGSQQWQESCAYTSNSGYWLPSAMPGTMGSISLA